jgi:hypothetical protein
MEAMMPILSGDADGDTLGVACGLDAASYPVLHFGADQNPVIALIGRGICLFKDTTSLAIDG